MIANRCRPSSLGIAGLVALVAGWPGVLVEPAVPGPSREASGVAQPQGSRPVAEVRDDFSDPTSGWTRRTERAYGADYHHGTYVVWADNDTSSYIVPSGSYSGREFTDSRLVVEATKLYGPRDAHVGLSCREWDDGERRGLYFADIDGEGNLRIGLYDEDGQEILATAARPGLWREGANTLQLDCIGYALRFHVNGGEVLSAVDDRFDRGRLGLRAGGVVAGVTRVAFDDAVIIEGR